VLDRDHQYVERLCRPMRQRGWKVAEFTELPNRKTLAAMRLNVLLVDVALVDADAEWLADQVAGLPELAIVACTEHSTVAQRVHGLQVGLDGWLQKPCDPHELVVRAQAIVRARHSRRKAARPSIRSAELDVRASRYDAIAGGRNAGLTTREFEVLELLARQEGTVIARERIYAGIWGHDVPAGDRSVDTFVSRIRVKLKRISPDWHYLHTHAGVGYRFEAKPLASASTPGISR
jgi:DNA-binding response OmpR family regulator